MSDRDGDPKKRPPECREGDIISRHPDGLRCTWGTCLHLKETSPSSNMDGETYDCQVCGRHYRLYYDDMR